jgi:hypothetical protein
VDDTSKEAFVRRVARNLDLPEALVEKLTAPRPDYRGKGDAWKLVRMPLVDELKEYGLEGRFMSAGWRTALRAIIEDE